MSSTKDNAITYSKVHIYSEKAKKICEIFALLLTTVRTVKSKVKISQNFVAFSEHMNFTLCDIFILQMKIFVRDFEVKT